MKRARLDWTDYTVVILIVIILWVVASTILDTAKAHHDSIQNRPAPKAWKPPAIPQCDQPLWDRVKERCQ